MARLGEILVEEGMPEAMAGIGEKRIDRPAFGSRIELVDALRRGKVDLDRLDRGAERLEFLGCVVDGGPVGGDQQIVAVLGAELGKFISDAGRGSGDDGERFGVSGMVALSAGSRNSTGHGWRRAQPARGA